MKYLNDLLFWVHEREKIRIKKEAGERRPWTDDDALNCFRFCNVDRNNDRVTKWIHNRWLLPNEGHSNLAFAMGVARMVNWPDTLEALGYPRTWEPEWFQSTLLLRKVAGLKVWTNAYMITGGYSAGGESKEVIIARVLSRLYDQLQLNPIKQGDTLAVAAEKLQVPGIGSFLSAQIVADLKRVQPLADAKDWTWWCAPGPGSQMGLAFLHDRSEVSQVSNEQFITEVNEVRELLENAGVLLCAQNTQNCLCEFSKYVRAKYLGRRLKSAYRPHV